MSPNASDGGGSPNRDLQSRESERKQLVVPTIKNIDYDNLREEE